MEIMILTLCLITILEWSKDMMSDLELDKLREYLLENKDEIIRKYAFKELAKKVDLR